MLNVALIGVGNIGLLFDSNKVDEEKALSHIKAIYLHKEFDLKYVVDINLDNSELIRDFFPKAKLFTSHLELLNKDDIDILVIASPTNTHFNILKDFQENENIKLFFMEKPLFNTFNEYENLQQKIKDKIVVNYLRRFDKSIQELKKSIDSSEKKIEKVILDYCKGLKNNGSHLIDLVNFLFDNPKILSSKILSSSIGFDEKDLCYDIYIQCEYKKQIIPIYFISHDHRKYNLIQLSIYKEDSLIKYLNSKSQIDYFDVVEDENFPSYKVLSNTPNSKEVDSLFLMLSAYDKIEKVIKVGEKNISSFEDELKNKEFLEYILKDV